jgi:hypothetical protein
MTSSITFNVGAPTFGVRFTLSSEGQLCHRFYYLSHSTAFPNWNGSPARPSMALKTNYLVKPSSNTLNVGAPTFFEHSPIAGDSPVVAQHKLCHYVRPNSVCLAVSQ